MAYTALYRKFRPSEFDEVKGQDHIVTTLKNQLKADRIGHAYLFCGTRGTGKTTIAKILAKAVNCEHPIEGSPCGECESCKKIAAGNSLNVIEIDAASNNGVDNIREIIDEVQYSPTEGKYKVYIIDEVHMLSTGAFNALLKTLEEPPSYVIFILATTEAHKIPITILSRCQRYDFKRISIKTIADRLSDLMKREQIEVEDRALYYVAKAADGSLRDALSLLDQCLAFYFGQKLTYDNVLNVLGVVDVEIFQKIFEAILEEDLNTCMDLLEEIVITGRDLTQFTTDFTWYFRNLLLLKTSDHGVDRIDLSKEQLAQMEQVCEKTDSETLMRYIRIFSDLSTQMKYASQKRVLLEVAFIKLCRPAMESNYDSLVQRVKQIEKMLEKGTFQRLVSEERKVEVKQENKSVKLESLPQAIPEDLKELAKNWAKILNSLSPLLKTFLRGAKPSVDESGNLVLVFTDELDKESVEEETHKKELQKAIASCIGKQVAIRTFYQGDATMGGGDSLDNLSKLIKMNVEYVD